MKTSVAKTTTDDFITSKAERLIPGASKTIKATLASPFSCFTTFFEIE